MTSAAAPEAAPSLSGDRQALRPDLEGSPEVGFTRGGLVLLGAAMGLRVLDIFVLRLDERIGEIILSKSLGLILLLGYVRAARVRLPDLSLEAQQIRQGVAGGLALVGPGLALAYGGTAATVRLRGGGPILGLTHSSLPYLAFLAFGNVVNALFEEGLFRGVLLRQFQLRCHFWPANLLQAGLFGLWHVVWPLKDLMLGKTDPSGALASAAQYALASALMGLTMGHLVRARGGLWAPLAWHTVWNSALNTLAVGGGAEASADHAGGAVSGLAVVCVLAATNLLVGLRKPSSRTTATRTSNESS